MKILIIDDDKDLSGMLSRFLKDSGHSAAEAATGKEGLDLLESFAPDAILLDHNLPDHLGLELLPLLRERRPQAAVLMITGLGSTKDAVAAMKLGAENYLEKPFELDELSVLLEALAEKRQRTAKPAAPAPASSASRHSGYLFLRSPSMQQLYTSVKQVADKSQVNVLIQGETGTGKEHVARLVHEQSLRSKGPFIELHCAALPESLLESELFGYEAGAFTDARRPKPGLFEQAQGGTLFLDEIGELPLSTQSKLLKVLEEKQLRRLGSVKLVDLDVRLVTATNRNLLEEVKERRFRSDLYYRLNVVALALPPLRERREDVVQLAQFFLEKFSKDFSKDLEPLDESVLQSLRAYAWPGNVRELRNTLERLALQSEGKVKPEDLRLGKAGSAPLKPAAASNGAEEAAYTDAPSLRAMMEECRWNRTLAAERLGISRPTLLKWLNRFELL